MKASIALLHIVRLLAVGSLLAAAMLGCQSPAATTATNAAATTPASTPAVTGSTATPAAPTAVLSGSAVLAQPAVGLDMLSSYHQSYSSSMKGTYQGQPYSAISSQERSVNATDESNLVNSTTTGQTPVFLQLTRLGGHTYVQQRAGQACRAQDGSDPSAADEYLNPASKLPAVYAATKVGSETLDGIAATHLHFTADGVRSQTGKSGTADGEVWVAENGGAVLKYQLTVGIKDGDFTGTRTWTYELTGANKGTAVALPDGCLPLLSDLPALTGATEVMSIPGFIRYSAVTNLAAAVNFFREQLPTQKWYALPGDEPQAADALLKFARAEADGSGQVLVIQLSTQGQGVMVVIQILKTHKPITAVTPQALVITPELSEPTETLEPGTSTGLPADIPIYPGASVLMQNSQILMCQADAAVAQVEKFYQDQMSAAGWTLGDHNSMGGVVTQEWKKGDETVMVIMTYQNGKTQIVISPQ